MNGHKAARNPFDFYERIRFDFFGFNGEVILVQDLQIQPQTKLLFRIYTSNKRHLVIDEQFKLLWSEADIQVHNHHAVTIRFEERVRRVVSCRGGARMRKAANRAVAVFQDSHRREHHVEMIARRDGL